MTNDIVVEGRRPARPAGSLGWGLMVLLGLLVAVYGVAGIVGAPFVGPLVAQRKAIVPVALIVHLAGGVLAIAIGPFQLNGRLRSRFLGAHRWLGRIYVIAVLAGGSAGLVLARISEGGPVAHVGFGLLGVLWIVSTTMAYLRIRARRTEAHRIWMVRSYALTFAAVTLRIYLPLSLAAGIEFVPVYQVISWLCWVPNLVVAEWVVLRPRTDRAVRVASADQDR